MRITHPALPRCVQTATSCPQIKMIPKSNCWGWPRVGQDPLARGRTWKATRSRTYIVSNETPPCVRGGGIYRIYRCEHYSISNYTRRRAVYVHGYVYGAQCGRRAYRYLSIGTAPIPEGNREGNRVKLAGRMWLPFDTLATQVWPQKLAPHKTSGPRCEQICTSTSR